MLQRSSAPPRTRTRTPETRMYARRNCATRRQTCFPDFSCGECVEDKFCRASLLPQNLRPQPEAAWLAECAEPTCFHWNGGAPWVRGGGTHSLGSAPIWSSRHICRHASNRRINNEFKSSFRFFECRILFHKLWYQQRISTDLEWWNCEKNLFKINQCQPA